MHMKKGLIFFLVCMIGGNMISAANPKTYSINVISYNIRYDNNKDGENVWSNRKDLAANLIKFHDADIFGSQEVVHNQFQDLLNRLPGYDYIGVGRSDGKTEGEYSPIIYKKDRFQLIKSGNFWLSEDINAV